MKQGQITKKTSILIVDDEKVFGDILSRTLMDVGFDTYTANTASEALSLIKKNSYDLVVSDLNMPEMDGIELIREILNDKPNQCIVVITGFPSRESQEEAFRMGVVNYLVKPFSLERFLEIVEKAIQGDAQGEPGIRGPVELTCEDLIQMHAFERRSIILEILNHKDNGKIYFKDGKVVHAETKKLEGKEAFYEIQSWKTGIFKTEPLKTNVENTIGENVEVLLLEGAAYQDELNKSKKSHNSEGVGLEGNSTRERRHSMPSMIEEINAALKDLADNTPGLSLALLVDNEGLPVTRYSSIQLPEGTSDKVAVASIALLGLARRNADQLGLQGFQEVLIKADTGYVYSVSVGAQTGYALVARTDQNVTLGALFMTVRGTRERINKAMGVA